MAAIAPLRDMVRKTGNDDAGEASHALIPEGFHGEHDEELVHCHRNSILNASGTKNWSQMDAFSQITWHTAP
ncbi:hypothetical protein [Mesorhizobium sp. M2D.F.Ca.ET.223.01.1.1]|uniref:hypothetical protein n=1 Tax=Mesorhizobium sp. M2D.F.Ca.ET.223.01.1.1 TaxID=2563940 RepID=UPI00142F0111|nr:hypothetical protein [Mesorhizobium sp. M2D.F.Ca.ET.223.01.1.1]